MAQHIACPHCDQLLLLPPLAHREQASCPNCKTKLGDGHRNADQKIVALSISALILLFSAILYPFISFSNKGITQTITLLDAAKILIDNQSELLGILLDLVILGIPAFLLAAYIPLHLGMIKVLPAKMSIVLLKLLYWLRPWVMSEIFLIGVLVSMVKIMSMADVGFGLSFYAYVGFVGCYLCVMYLLDMNALWQQLPGTDKAILPKQQGKAFAYNIRACHVCQLLSTSKECPRCHTRTHVRNPKNIQWVLALTLTSLIFYIPANVFPIMHTWVYTSDEPSTILAGVFTLWKMGSYPIAIIIFVASIIVPIAKLCVLFWLCYLVQFGNDFSQTQAAKLYQLTEIVGKWSMIDVFVVTILVALVQLGVLMSITPGIGALFFAAMVITSMLAAHIFDPKLLWDKKVG